MVTIRLARGGNTHRPVYTIVATDKRNARDGKFIAKLGQYNPAATEEFVGVKTEEIKAWLDKGAQLSGALKSLFKKNKITIA